MSKSYGYKRLKRILGLFAAGALTTAALPAYGAGFQIQEQNVTNLGTAYAGTGALAEDASVQFYNAAGLTRLCQEQISLAAIGIYSTYRYEVSTATPTRGVGNIGPGWSKPKIFSVVPALYYFARLTDDWVFGISIAQPFGLRTKYDDDSIARYMATATELRTFDISPNLAYSFCNGFSLGAGIDFINGYARYNAALGDLLGQGAYYWFDGYQENTLSNWGYGAHIAAMYEWSDCDRISLQYRTRVKIKGEGYSISRIAYNTGESSQGVKADLKLPDSVLLSGYHAFDDCWAMMADVHWTHWKYFDQIVLRYENGTTTTAPQNYKNTWRVALGGSYRPCCEWTWRFGLAWDQSPVRDEYRNSRVPDANRIWLGLGGRYRFTNCLALDFGYSHIFIKTADLNETAPIAGGGGTQTRQRAVGEVKGRGDIFGLQLTWDI